MFQKLIIFTIAGIIMTQSGSAFARSAGQSGMLGGAAGGAILGQAIGRDTEGTLLGTAIGGVLGYIVGNEMDKQIQPPSRTIYSSLPPETYGAPVQRAPRYSEEQLCRPAEILATIDGRPERVNTIVCLEGDEWVVQSAADSSFERTVVIERDDFYRSRHPRHFHEHHAGNRHKCKKSTGSHHFRNIPPSFAGHENVKIVLY